MPKYPLEWGWEQPDVHSSPVSNGEPRETLLGRRSDHDANIVPTAAGDLRCQACPSGGNWGATGAYEIGGTIMCRDCAVKILGIENFPGGEQNETLERFELKPR